MRVTSNIQSGEILYEVAWFPEISGINHRKEKLFVYILDAKFIDGETCNTFFIIAKTITVQAVETRCKLLELDGIRRSYLANKMPETSFL
jgi:hypothetical protein